MARNRNRQQQTQHNQVQDNFEEDVVETLDEVIEEAETQVEEQETVQEEINESQQVIAENNQADVTDIPTQSQTTQSPFEEVVVEDQKVEIQDLPSAHDLNKTKSIYGSIDLEALRKEVSLSGSNTFSLIEKYLEEMAPAKPQTNDSIAKHQMTLYRVFDTVINRLDDEDFQVVWHVLSNLFNELKDSTFNETTVHRGVDVLANKWNPSQFNFFFRILTLLIATKEPKTRYESVQSIDWDFITQYNFSDTSRTRLMDFYSNN